MRVNDVKHHLFKISDFATKSFMVLYLQLKQHSREESHETQYFFFSLLHHVYSSHWFSKLGNVNIFKRNGNHWCTINNCHIKMATETLKMNYMFLFVYISFRNKRNEEFRTMNFPAAWVITIHENNNTRFWFIYRYQMKPFQIGSWNNIL